MKGKMPAGMPGNMNQMMKQVQKMQRDMEKTQQELEEKIYESSAGGGTIHVKITGKKELLDSRFNDYRYSCRSISSRQHG